jgi:hypothetical protein
LNFAESGFLPARELQEITGNGRWLFPSLRKIEVMTPEHCLALLSYAQHAFADVGLMVFDECHHQQPAPVVYNYAAGYGYPGAYTGYYNGYNNGYYRPYWGW